ncbi:uncharacterized protein [Anoplolepis gracilipes]|uniref:uncharacterized protein n=1 Tax=Anoplolepis gracilipes TaxID=354296 RepID=UPI003B9E78A0
MRREYIFIRLTLTWFFLFLCFKSLHGEFKESENEYSKGCAHIRCERGSQCIKRRFWCSDPPCPGMLYCTRSRKESLKGPPTCDTVRCNRRHICIVKVRDCYWDKGCKQQGARCVSEKEYYEGGASCAGFKCPFGKRCILRETYCINPPCKLIRSCAKAADVQTWFDECRSLKCISEYECFLRRLENNCFGRECLHTPDCTLTVEDELISKYCYGWICPRSQKCIIRIIGPCKGYNCTIRRLCRTAFITSQTLTTPTVQHITTNHEITSKLLPDNTTFSTSLSTALPDNTTFSTSLSTALPDNTTFSTSLSTALPDNTTFSTSLSTALPDNTTFSTSLSTALPDNTTFSTSLSTALPDNTTFSTSLSTALPNNTTYLTSLSTALPDNTTFSTSLSTALPNNTTYLTSLSTASPNNTTFSTSLSTALPNNTTYLTSLSTASPNNTTFSTSLSTALPNNTTYLTSLSTASPNNTTFSTSLSTALPNNTTYLTSLSTALPDNTTFSTSLSTALPDNTTFSTSLSTALPDNTTFSTSLSTALPDNTTFSTSLSTALPDNTTFSTSLSTALPDNTTFSTSLSTALPDNTTFSTSLSTALPNNTTYLTSLSTALPDNTTFSTSLSTALPDNTTFSTSLSTALPDNTTFSTSLSTALPDNTTFSTSLSTALPDNTTFSTSLSTALPDNTTFSTSLSTALPDNTTFSTSLSTALPNNTTYLTSLSTASPNNTTFSTTNLPVKEKNESTTPCNGKKLEMPKIFIAGNYTIPLLMMLKGINLIGQNNYPIWINKDRTTSLEIKDENVDAWGYLPPQEPHRILLPPYEPVILVENMKEREQFFPFFTYAFDRPFNEAADLRFLPETSPIDRTVASKDISTIVDKVGNYIKDSAIVEVENFKTNYFDDSSDYYMTFSAMEKTNTISSNIHKESNNYYDDYEWRPWFMIHDYLERNKPQSVRKRELKSSVVESATDNSYQNYTAAGRETFVKNQIGDEEEGRISVTRFMDNNFVTVNPSITTGQSDYSSRDKKLYGLANYLYDTISVDDIDKSEREYEGSPRNKILNISNEEGN